MFLLAPISFISFGSVDNELSKVRSDVKRTELLDILHSEDPDHYSRLWMAGFLKFVGYTLEEICAIIDKEACWSGYDAKTTWCQLSSLFKRQHNNQTISSQFEGVGAAPGGTFQSPPFERKRRPCAIKWIPCRECPDLIDRRCKWVSEGGV